MKLLGKLNDVIDYCEDNKKDVSNVELSYSELNYIRRLILTDEYAQSLAIDNLRRARDVWK